MLRKIPVFQREKSLVLRNTLLFFFPFLSSAFCFDLAFLGGKHPVPRKGLGFIRSRGGVFSPYDLIPYCSLTTTASDKHRFIANQHIDSGRPCLRMGAESIHETGSLVLKMIYS